METSSEIVRELAQIRLATYAILLIVVVTAVGTAVRTYSYVKQLARKELGDLFRSEARDLFEKGHLDKLVAIASDRIKERPNDAHAHWYLARVYRLWGNWDHALNEMEIVGKLVPEWRAEYVMPFIRAVEEEKNRTVPANQPLQPAPADRRG